MDKIVIKTEDNGFQTDDESSKKCKYECGRCKFLNVLTKTDPIRCTECGYRILYKLRGERSIQYIAR